MPIDQSVIINIRPLMQHNILSKKCNQEDEIID